MTIYKSKREQIKEVIENFVIPGIIKNDIDYNKVIDGIAKETGASKVLVVEMLQYYINNGDIAELRILTIPKEKIDNWLKNMKIEAEKINNDFREAGL